MRALYTLLAYLLLPFISVWLWLNRTYRTHMGERFGRYEQTPNPVSYWIHAASVGEVLAARPLVEAILERHPQKRILITTMTPTGRAFVQSSFGERVQLAEFPLDLPFVIRRLLSQFQPRCVIFLETELWPNLLHILQQEAIPVVIANGRLSIKTWRFYMTLHRAFHRQMAKLEWVAAQSGSDAERFITLGAPPERVSVVGNLKFDVQVDSRVRPLARELRKAWGSRPVFLAASTRDGEELKVLQAFAQVREQYPDALLVLVPRHPGRFDDVAEIVKQAGLSLRRRTDVSDQPVAEQVYLGDTMGELPAFYQAADVIFIGGSLVPLGGHNPLEAAAQGKGVLIGPEQFNFADVYSQLLSSGGALEISNADELAQRVISLFGDTSARKRLGKAAHRVVEENRGGVATTVALIEDIRL